MEVILIIILLLFGALASLILCLSNVEVDYGPLEEEDENK